jgi:hypothetical protein
MRDNRGPTSLTIGGVPDDGVRSTWDRLRVLIGLLVIAALIAATSGPP